MKRYVTVHSISYGIVSLRIHLLESGTDLRCIQELLGSKAQRQTTGIYTHVGNKDIGKIKSPFDSLQIKGR
jgi:integrase/recombinase XerD